jgi:IS605 OrfB family transposase
VEPLGKPGVLRITGKRGKWVADVAYPLPEPEPTRATGIMGVDPGVKVPAVVHVIDTGTRFFGNGRQLRARRRQFYTKRKVLQHAKKVRAMRTSQGKEARWMRDTNHELSQQIVSHARRQRVGIIRLEQLAGIHTRTHQRTARTSRGATGRKAAKARKNNRMMATWTFHHLATFIAYKAARVGIAVHWVDPAHTSQRCPACFCLNTADDRHYVCAHVRMCACAHCGWTGHRDAVGAINISRRNTGTGPHGVPGDRDRVGATVAGFDLARMVDGPPETALGRPRFPQGCEALIPKANARAGEPSRTSRLQGRESQGWPFRSRRSRQPSRPHKLKPSAFTHPWVAIICAIVMVHAPVAAPTA